MLTGDDGWMLEGAPGSRIPLRSVPAQGLFVRRSVVTEDRSRLFRTWTPEKGNTPLSVMSPWFRPSAFLSIPVTGSNEGRAGDTQAWLESRSGGKRIEVFRGSVGVNANEALVAIPTDWLSGDVRLSLISQGRTNVGVGSVFRISLLSSLKSSFVGLLPYAIVAYAVLAFVMFAGAACAARSVDREHIVPCALASLGAVSLTTVYLCTWTLRAGLSQGWRTACVAALGAVLAIVMWRAGKPARLAAAKELAPYARLWFLAAFGYSALLHVASHGLGHWEPNFRFWPASWSSDNELPWKYAEALRLGWDLRSVFGGGWVPTDRPPLMAGAYCLVADLFDLMQCNNDGAYLTGVAFNLAAVVLNALWVPAAWWLLQKPGQDSPHEGDRAVLAFITCLPFTIFNTIYGWPKAFGAAFALAAFHLAVIPTGAARSDSRTTGIVLFFALSAFSMMAHASTAFFLAPLGIAFLAWNARGGIGGILLGGTVALAIMGSWSEYKRIVLPSSDPLTKYALTGDFGFDNAAVPLWHMVRDRYASMDFHEWMATKTTMILDSFVPLRNAVTASVSVTAYGASSIDMLRARDFLTLSAGNASILVLAGLCGLAACRKGSHRSPSWDPRFPALVGIAAASWALYVLVCLTPVNLPVWPQAALFGLALGGAATVHREYPRLFGVVLAIQAAYAIAIWIVQPLRHAVAIDIGAVVLALIVIALGIHTARPAATKTVDPEEAR